MFVFRKFVYRLLIDPVIVLVKSVLIDLRVVIAFYWFLIFGGLFKLKVIIGCFARRLGGFFLAIFRFLFCAFQFVAVILEPDFYLGWG